MFTGLIHSTGTVNWIKRGRTGGTFEINAPDLKDFFRIGASIAVNGVCQTITSFNSTSFQGDMIQATLEKTNLSLVKTGDRVNLEPALKMGDSLDGHLVQGHVGAMGKILSLEQREGTRILRISLPDPLKSRLRGESSVAVDGISLTVSRCLPQSFEINIIPETWGATNLAHRKPGDWINLEPDMLAPSQEPASTLTESKLHSWGYL